MLYFKLQQILLVCIQMIDRALGLSPPQRQSFYFMFYVKQITVADNQYADHESQIKFSIYKGPQIFNQTRQPITLKLVKGRARLQKVELSFFLKDFNANRKVDFVAKMLKITGVSEEQIGQLVIDTHKYIDTYLNTGVDRVEEKHIIGQYIVTYLIFTDKSRHDLQKTVKAYKQQLQYEHGSSQQKVRQRATELIKNKLSTPDKNQRTEQKQSQQPVEQHSAEKSENQSKIVQNQYINYEPLQTISKQIEVETETKDRYDMHRSQDMPIISKQSRQYEVPAVNEQEQWNQQYQPKINIKVERSVSEQEQEQSKPRDGQYNQRLIELADNKYQNEQYRNEDKQQTEYGNRQINQNYIKFEQQLRQQQNQPRKLDEQVQYSGQQESVNRLSISHQKANQDAASQIVENINLVNFPKYYDTNKQYFEPPKEDNENVRRPLSTPRELQEEPLSNILQDEFQEQLQQKQFLNTQKSEPVTTFPMRDKQQQNQKPRHERIKSAPMPTKEEQNIDHQINKTDAEDPQPKHSDFKLTLKILIIIIITGMIVYYLLRPVHTPHKKITGPKVHHKPKQKVKVEKASKRSQSKKTKLK